MNLFEKGKKYFLNWPDSLPWGEWEKWENEVKKDKPILWFIFETIPSFFSSIFYNIKEFIYHLNCKYFKKYHHIKIDIDRFLNNEYDDDPNQNKKNNLKNYHWIDSDTKILYGNFQILVDFVENEIAADIVDWSADKKHQEIYDEFMFLYKWWTKLRPMRDTKIPSIHDFGYEENQPLFSINHNDPRYRQYSKAIDSYFEKEQEYDNEDTEMLIRLISIRKWLWT